MKYLFALFFMAVLSGCTTVVPAITKYKITTDEKYLSFKNTDCFKNKTLKIAQPFAPAFLMSYHMPYVQGDIKQYTYTQTQWSQAPNIALKKEFLKHIRKSGLFKNVLTSKSRGKSDMILEINIEDFMQYFDEDTKNSYVNIEISVSLLDAKKGSVVASKNFNCMIDSKTPDANGGAKALNNALGKIINKTVKWLGETCK